MRTQKGGRLHANPRSVVKKIRASTPAAPKWIKTARKATVSGGRGKPAVIKTVYRNSETGEHRVRKMATRRDGTQRVTYVKFVVG